MKRYLLGAAMLVAAVAIVRAQADPLVIVVHGIGYGGDAGKDGWSNATAKAWGVRLREVTFRLPGQTEEITYTNFAKNAGTWAQSVQDQMKSIVKANPGRRVIVVAHSWGSVATAIALDGGAGTDRVVNAMEPGVRIDELVTLGSPLGRANDPNVAFNLQQLGVVIPDGRPKAVRHWTNIYDVADPVSMQSHNLAGAQNEKVDGSGNWYDMVGTSAHTGIWTNPKVIEFIKRTVGTPSAGAVRFVVRAESGEDLANARIVVDGVLNSPSADFRIAGATDESGVALIYGIPLGVYTVTTSHRSCTSSTSGVVNIRPGDTKQIRLPCESPGRPTTRAMPRPPATKEAPPTPPPTKSDPTAGRSGAGSGPSEAQVVAEYRRLLPLALQADRKPWHTRNEILANAVKQGSGYHVNYKTYCIIENGTDKGKDYPCYEFETVFDLGGLKSAIADMRRRVGQ